MPRREKTGRVIISNHAYDRYLERVGPIKLEALSHYIRRCLANQLRTGKEAKDSSIEVILSKKTRAVVEPDIQGYWVCKTVYIQ